jgi:type II restriction/modification system DNA methylase subunit YeeA
MNTAQLKKFAQAARIKLLEQVGAKLDYVLTHDTAELRGKANTLKKLNEALDKTGKAALIERVAYTWFNRLVALRFMDVNGYQPIGISVITPSKALNSVSPELLDAAHSGNIPEALNVDYATILKLLDGWLASTNHDNDVYRILLVAACNHLHGIFPFLFERIDDYTELLLPDDLTSPFSIVKDVVNGMPEEDCTAVEIIGWLYQFYISDKKDEVFASKSAVKKEDIPAATQLFTPRWIVEYMVQNTVGKLWLQNKPNSRLKEHMPYFIDSPSTGSEEYLKVSSVEEIRLLDQACGSGHILVYGFDLLYKIYEEEGYNPSEIPGLIIKHNLFGFEIDERAAQLAGFALLMKARSYYRRFLRNPIEPNILCFEDLAIDQEEVLVSFERIGYTMPDALKEDLKTMQEATNFGSLIVPKTSYDELENVRNLIRSRSNGGDAFLQYNLEQISKALEQLIPLSQQYHCVVDNPPYMGGGNMNKPLGDYVKTNYPDSKADLMACFMEAGLGILHPKGFLGMINQHSWMFLSSYEKLRIKLIGHVQFDTNLHLGPRAFPEIGGEVVQNTSFTFWKTKPRGKGSYVRLVNYNTSEEKRSKTLDAIQQPESVWYYTANQKDFEKIPGSPIGYWIKKRLIDSFSEGNSIMVAAPPKQGLATGNNDCFLRNWFEVVITKKKNKWIPINKGGQFRKWYGNNQFVVNWDNNGFLIKNYRDTSGKLRSRPQNQAFYFREGFTWSTTSSSSASFRYSPPGFLFETKGSTLFPLNKQDFYSICGFLNSKIVSELLLVLSPTLDYKEGPIGLLPYIENNHSTELVKANIELSKLEWDSKENSWDFPRNAILQFGVQDLEESYDLYQQYWRNKFFQLHRNEVELNRQFIEIYGLQDELSPDVPLEEITILKEETSIEHGELVFHADEVFAQFVSYAVGCMFGRYSLDKEGLILANQGETHEDYLKKVEKTREALSFEPDEDNVIPVLDEEWFQDDIVARFHQFLKASFGEAQFQKNLTFVEESLGKDIRKYFVKDFYKDHIKRYKKRPIYWMFSSPKGYFNVLIYMHRYTPDTLSAILNGYLREFIGKLELQRINLGHTLISASPADRNKAQKEVDKIDLMLADCRQYESDVLYPLAAERIPIDLDDGVLVNYNKFGTAITPVDGLNDKKTKEKVRKFDWIDTTQIR